MWWVAAAWAAWVPVGPGDDPVDAVAIDPEHVDRWLRVGVGGSVGRASSAGAEWSRIAEPVPDAGGRKAAVWLPDRVCAARSDGAWCWPSSTDPTTTAPHRLRTGPVRDVGEV